MKFISSLTGLGILTAAALVQGEDLNNGKRLHEENCMRCHTPDIYIRDNRKIKSFAQLEKQIRQCELANDLTWLDEDISDVTAYLNATYYLFEIK
ncbi:MAG: hypothetical protein HW411_1225 [Gammaproteobacteria bacterium]|nr:hypothetical protein [Gammaproteobacteria bacterium]